MGDGARIAIDLLRIDGKEPDPVIHDDLHSVSGKSTIAAVPRKEPAGRLHMRLRTIERNASRSGPAACANPRTTVNPSLLSAPSQTSAEQQPRLAGKA